MKFTFNLQLCCAAMLLCFTEEIRKFHPRSTRLADSTLTITPSMWFRSTCGIAWTSKQQLMCVCQPAKDIMDTCSFSICVLDLTAY